MGSVQTVICMVDVDTEITSLYILYTLVDLNDPSVDISLIFLESYRIWHLLSRNDWLSEIKKENILN